MQLADDYLDLKGQNFNGSFLADILFFSQHKAQNHKTDTENVNELRMNPLCQVVNGGEMHDVVRFGAGLTKTTVFSLDLSVKVNNH